MELRTAGPADRGSIEEILRSTGVFSAEEIGWALELVDAASLGSPEYIVEVAELPAGSLRAIAGYVCFGPTPRTQGVWDLYWIAVARAHQRSGLGARLLGAVEEEVEKRSGRLLLIETSSKEGFEPTRRFYERRGYRETSRIKDFYRVQHDKIVYAKTL